MSLLRQIIECIIAPRSAFRSLLKESNLRYSILLLSTIAIIATLATYIYLEKLQYLITIFPIIKLISVFSSWLISSSLLHIFTRVQEGKSSMRNMLILSAFTSTPLLIQHTLRLIDSLTINPEQVLHLMTWSQIFENRFLNTALNSALNKLSIFWLWSIYLQVIALQENYKISKTRSIITVIVTFIIMILISTFLPF
jgi:hypothetical protein